MSDLFRRLPGVRVLLFRFLGRLHCGLIVAICCTAVTEFLFKQGFLPDHMNSDPTVAFLRGLLFVIPLALSYYAAKKIPTLWGFLAASLPIIGLAWLLVGNPVAPILTVFICVVRARLRMDEDHHGESALDAPSYFGLAAFLVAFYISAVLTLPNTQRLAVIGAVFYLLVCLAYRGLKRIDDYLSLNRTMHGLPARRIRRTAGAAVCAAVLLAAVLLLPAAFSLSGDYRIDLDYRKSATAGAAREEEAIALAPYVPPEDEEGDGFFASEDPPFQLPPIVSYLFYAISAVAISTLALYAIYELFRNFRRSYTDSRDVVRFLSDQDQAESAAAAPKRQRPAVWDRSPNAQIRRKYRKTLLRASIETPQPWQSPEELEQAAQLTVPQLHALYEKARYGPVPCTAEDLRLLKEKT